MSILYVNRGITKTVPLDWENIEGDTIPEGTPIGIDGKIHNNENAIGLSVKPLDRLWDGNAELLIAGFVDCDKLPDDLSEDAMKALHSITFVDDGAVVPVPGDAITAATTTAIGGVKMGAAVEDATSESVVTQFNALLASLVAAGVLAEVETDPVDP